MGEQAVCLSQVQKYKLLVHHRLYLSNDHTIGETNTFSHKKMISSLYFRAFFFVARELPAVQFPSQSTTEEPTLLLPLYLSMVNTSVMVRNF